MLINSNLLLYGLLGLVLILGFFFIRLEIRFRRLLGGKEARSLEQIIVEMAQALDKLNEQHSLTQTELQTLHQRTRESVRHVRTLRFNPFPGEGGNQSFATALLNDDGHGVVISGLYTRGQVNVYAKPVRERASDHELSAEEKAVLEPILS